MDWSRFIILCLISYSGFISAERNDVDETRFVPTSEGLGTGDIGTNITTTTPAPPMPPHPLQGNWSVTDPDTNISCILLSSMIAVIVPYRTLENTTKNATVPVPSNAAVSGTCGSDQQSLVLSWNYSKAGAATSNNTLIFLFSRKHKSSTSLDGDKFVLSQVIFRVFLNPVNFPGALNTTLLLFQARNLTFFETKVDKSHKCRIESRIPLTLSANSVNTTAYLMMSNIQLEPFRTRMDTDFDEAEDCEPQGLVTSDVIPIIVGSILGAIILGALITYLVGRLRARRVDYSAM